jgi:phage-related minor tail protein
MSIFEAFARGEQGALNFKNILREVLIEIQKTLFQVLVMDRITKGIKNLPIFNVNATLDQGIKVGDMSASGGTIQRNAPTLVGERGPELFVPGSAGVIKNNADTKQMVGGGGGVVITQNLNFALGVTNTVRAEVMNMLPAIQQSTYQQLQKLN